MSSKSAFIEAHHLQYRYSPSFWKKVVSGGSNKVDTVLRDVGFELPQGSHVTLFGQEACGKTTLLKLLAGLLEPSKGHVLVNGKKPSETKHVKAGYVSTDIVLGNNRTAYDLLMDHAKTQKIADCATRVNSVADSLELSSFLHREVGFLSLTERLRVSLAQAAICDTPLVLMDDVTDHFSPDFVKHLLKNLFAGRTVVIATRSAKAADDLDLPVLLLHEGRLTHQGTIDEISLNMSCPRIVDVWVEGLRYDILRKLRRHTGVLEARLMPSDQFAGQRLRITLKSARYLPAMYDLISQVPLVQVKELPSSLNEVITRLDAKEKNQESAK